MSPFWYLKDIFRLKFLIGPHCFVVKEHNFFVWPARTWPYWPQRTYFALSTHSLYTPLKLAFFHHVPSIRRLFATCSIFLEIYLYCPFSLLQGKFLLVFCIISNVLGKLCLIWAGIERTNVILVDFSTSNFFKHYFPNTKQLLFLNITKIDILCVLDNKLTFFFYFHLKNYIL